MENARYEIKMTAGALKLDVLRAWIRLPAEGFTQAYPGRRVNSIYFDTLDAHCLQDNLTGVGERAKLRFRWYGEERARVRGQLELKQRANQLIRKQVAPLDIDLDLGEGSWCDIIRALRQCAPEPFASRLALCGQPLLIVSYWREYYESADHQIRLTLDSDVERYEQLLHAGPNVSLGATFAGRLVVELKAPPHLCRRLSNLLTTWPLRVSRHSKYASGVQQALSFAE